MTAAVCACFGVADRAGADDVNFNDHIKPLFEQHCNGCHNQDDPSGGLNLTSYRGVIRGGGGGSVIAKGNPSKSRLFRLVSHAEKPVMPPEGPKLPDDELSLIRRWIAAGAPEAAGQGTPTADAGGKPVKGAVPVLADAPPALGLADEEARHPAPVTSLAAHPERPIIAVPVAGEIILIDTEQVRYLTAFPFPYGEVFVLKFNRTGKLLLAAGGVNGVSGRAVVWNVETGRRLIEVGDDRDVILAADLSPDQLLLAVGGPKKKLQIYSTADGRLIRTIDRHSDWIVSTAFSPDGILLACADRAGRVFLWETLSGYEFAELPQIEKPVTALAWRSDAETLAVADEEGKVRLFGVEPAEETASWSAHPTGVRSVTFAPDGETLLTCGRDKRVKWWDGEGKELRTVATAADEALVTVFAADGKMAMFGDYAGNIRLVDCESAQSLATIELRRPRLSEILKPGGPVLSTKLHAIRIPREYNWVIVGVAGAIGFLLALAARMDIYRRRWKRLALAALQTIETSKIAEAVATDETSKRWWRRRKPAVASKPTTAEASTPPSPRPSIIPRPHFARILRGSRTER